MSTILEYPCGCRYYSDSTTTDLMHLCDDHKIQACNDALNEFMSEKMIQDAKLAPKLFSK